MDTKRGYKYRLYPSKRQLDKLSTQLNLCKDVYNKLLESCIEAYKKDSSFRINRKSLNSLLNKIKEENPRLSGTYSQVLQNVFDRVIKAYENFFRRVEEGNQKPGFPKFKQHYKSITYPQNNGSFKLKGNKLLLSKIGEIPIVLHRKIEGDIKTLTVERNRANQWFAVFSAEKEEKDAVAADPKEQKEVGIDRGLISLVVVSDGYKSSSTKILSQSRRKIEAKAKAGIQEKERL
jgi:putative transposase